MHKKYSIKLVCTTNTCRKAPQK